MENKISNQIKANILVDAIPYIKKYHNKTVVIKYGGNAMINEDLKESVMGDIVLLSLMGVKVVLVHGGGPAITELLNKTGKQSKFIDGLRYTDLETMDIVQMVLCGKINKDLVSMIEHFNGKSIGLSGIDNSMIRASKISGKDLGFVGEVESINPIPIINALDNGFIPVIASIGVGKDGEKYNINADTACSKIAGALKAENLILLTDTKGLLRDVKDESTLIPHVRASEVKKYIDDGIISGGMIPKIECCVDAIENGVQNAVIIDGRIDHSIIVEMMTNEGVVTLFTKE